MGRSAGERGWHNCQALCSELCRRGELRSMMHLFLSALDCGWNRLSEVVGTRHPGSDEQTGTENGAKMITSALRSAALSPLSVLPHDINQTRTS